MHTQDGTIIALSPAPSEAPVDRHWQTQVGNWLEAFFQGSFHSLETFPLSPQGTPFQRRVWALLREIPLGQIETYGSLARRLQTSPRAVGHALACNPIPILIPCHRVLAAHGLGGYSGAGGVMGKRFLLDLEGVTLVNDLS
ncbi:MAG: methylated-DNA--[protein]-cysteine S-methyltransferase [Magnetococcus sp. YQC-5]